MLSGATVSNDIITSSMSHWVDERGNPICKTLRLSSFAKLARHMEDQDHDAYEVDRLSIDRSKI